MLRFGVNTERQGKPMTCQMQSAIPERLQGFRSEELVYGLVAASAGSGHEFCPCQDAIESPHLVIPAIQQRRLKARLIQRSRTRQHRLSADGDLQK